MQLFKLGPNIALVDLFIETKQKIFHEGRGKHAITYNTNI